jgi:hypothetical protein
VTESLPSKVFTVEEVNRLIGTMETVMAEIERLGNQVERHTMQLQILDALWGPKLLDGENPDHAEFTEHQAGVDRAVERIQGLVLDEILDRGIRFPPGGLKYGLLDFPTTLDGRCVYLCWKRGESSVDQWHEITGGFSGRRPVTSEQERRMGI